MKIEKMIRSRLLVTLPSFSGILAMLWVMHKTGFFDDSLPQALFFAAISPYLIICYQSWHAPQGVLSATSAICAALLLWVIPMTCYSEGFGEASQHILVLSPIYLWPVVAATMIVNICISRLIKNRTTHTSKTE